MNNINRDRKVYNIINESNNIKLDINDTDLIYNYFNNDQDNIDINIEVNNNSNIDIKLISILSKDIKININIDIKGNNNNVKVYFRGLAKDKTSNVSICVKAEENTKDNVILEDLKGINEEGNITLLPILEIDTSDVNAEHYATVGSIDEDKLFYLMQKGIKKIDAYNILKNIFLYSLFDDSFRELIRKELNE